MILEVFLKDSGLVAVFSALIPTVLFLGLLLYFVIIAPRKSPKAKIVDIRDKFNVIGVATKTSKKTFFEDDLLLWKEYKRIKEKKLIENKKEEHSFIAARFASGNDETFEYLIGDIVENLNHVPVGLKGVTIPPTKYACFLINIKDEHSWAPAIQKIEKYVYEKWLPKSEYEINPDALVKELEYHDKRSADVTHTMKFYIAIRPKSK